MSNVARDPFNAYQLIEKLRKLLDQEIYLVDHVSTAPTPSIQAADYVVISLNLGTGPLGEVAQPLVQIYPVTSTRYHLVPLEGCPPANWFEIRQTLNPNYQDPDDYNPNWLLGGGR